MNEFIPIFIKIVCFIFLISLVVSMPSWIKKIHYKKKMLRSGIKDIDKMSGFEFENYLNYLFAELGYKPQVTKKTCDFGADLVLQGPNKIVVQAKRYGYKNNVSLDAIREIFAAQAYYGADEAWVITNSFYTKQAIELAKACNVKLLNRHDLLEFIIKVDPNK